MPPSTIILDNIVAVLRRSPAAVVHQDRHHAVMLTELFPDTLLELGGAVVSVLDRLDRGDVRLHQPNASVVDLQGYVDHTLPSHFYASP